MRAVRINAFRGSADSFTATLAENNIPYHEIGRLSDRPEARDMTLEVAPTDCGWDALAMALVAWLEARKSRRVNVITKDGTVLWLDGYAAASVAKALESTTHIAVIDANPSDESASLPRITPCGDSS